MKMNPIEYKTFKAEIKLAIEEILHIVKKYMENKELELEFRTVPDMSANLGLGWTETLRLKFKLLPFKEVEYMIGFVKFDESDHMYQCNDNVFFNIIKAIKEAKKEFGDFRSPFPFPKIPRGCGNLAIALFGNSLNEIDIEEKE